MSLLTVRTRAAPKMASRTRWETGWRRYGGYWDGRAQYCLLSSQAAARQLRERVADLQDVAGPELVSFFRGLEAGEVTGGGGGGG